MDGVYCEQIQQGWQFVTKAFRPNPMSKTGYTILTFKREVDDSVQITFTFDLNRRDLYMDLIEEFGLDEITAFRIKKKLS